MGSFCHKSEYLFFLLSISLSSLEMPLSLWIRFFFLILFIYLFLFSVLGLRCCVGFSLVVESRGCSLGVVCRLHIEVASLAVEYGL